MRRGNGSRSSEGQLMRTGSALADLMVSPGSAHAMLVGDTLEPHFANGETRDGASSPQTAQKIKVPSRPRR